MSVTTATVMVLPPYGFNLLNPNGQCRCSGTGRDCFKEECYFKESCQPEYELAFPFGLPGSKLFSG